ncbi:hypothetical protein [Thalassolituus pacificus]|uniref:Uncharacterized protein n=1 Tax=Thalassolituus pacificus TaxID=2975440 RepID=A0A9X2WGS4_9GAMM|nr:hypothetical protein [Thalassolituus pacificus]MCT7359924.1 hypothetical protein [Thalassolituus pacificus]
MNRSLFIFLLFLGGCGSGNEPPKGYIEACYGGDWNEKLVGKTPAYSAVIDVQKDQWPKLKVVLEKLAFDNNLEYFDSSEESKNLSMLYISACSNKGLWVHFDKRVWSFEGSDPHSPLPLIASVYIYDNEEIWKSIPEALDGLLKLNWPSAVNTNHSYESSLKNSLL